MESTTTTTVHWREKLVLFALAHWPGLKAKIDADGDGDFDAEDMVLWYGKVKDLLQRAKDIISGWASLTKGQRIDAVAAELAKDFPGVPGSIWVILEGIAYLALLIGLL